MALSQFTILQDLPQFSGNPRPGEPYFKPTIDCRTFLRTLDNYFAQNDIKSDEKKIQILFSLVNKQRGDAIRMITCYAGRIITFAQVKREMLQMYPSFRVTEFRHAAQSLLETKLTTTNMFCAMASLENASRNVAEAYVQHEPLTKGDFSEESKIAPLLDRSIYLPTPPPVPVPVVPQMPVPTASPVVPSTSTAALASQIPVPSTTATVAATPSTSATTAVTTSQATPVATPVPASVAPPVPASVAPPVTSRPAGAAPDIYLVNLLQNFAMHLFVSTQTHYKVYNKLASIGPRKGSTEFMAEAVKAALKYQTLMGPKGKTTQQNLDEVIWKVTQPQKKFKGKPQQTTQQQASPQQTSQSNQSTNVKCFNCNQPGHVRKQCPICSHCRAYGHTAKGCAKKIAESKGKFCKNCNLQNSHNTNECRKQNQQVRIIQGTEENTQDEGNEEDHQEWDPTEYEQQEDSSSSEDTY